MPGIIVKSAAAAMTVMRMCAVGAAVLRVHFHTPSSMASKLSAAPAAAGMRAMAAPSMQTSVSVLFFRNSIIDSLPEAAFFFIVALRGGGRNGFPGEVRFREQAGTVWE